MWVGGGKFGDKGSRRQRGGAGRSMADDQRILGYLRHPFRLTQRSSSPSVLDGT